MSIAGLVDDTLACLALEHPLAHARVRSALGGRRIDAHVAGEQFTVSLDPGAHATVRIETDLDIICALLFGERDAVDAIMCGQLEVLGAADDLIAVADAVIWMIEGAMRCVSVSGLVARLVELREERHGE